MDEEPLPLPEPDLVEPRPGGGPRGALLFDHKSAAEVGIDLGIGGVVSDQVLFEFAFALKVNLKQKVGEKWKMGRSYAANYLEKLCCPDGVKLQVEFERLMG